MTDMAVNTTFQSILTHNASELNNKQVVILCSGKYVYEILRIMEELSSDKAAVVTVEELLPFPEERIGEEIMSQLPKECQVYWVQEEPSNQGAFTYAMPHLNRLLSQHGLSPLTYLGRKALSAVA